VNSQLEPEHTIVPMRLLTMPAMTFFHVSSRPTAFCDLDSVLDPLLESLYAAKAQAGLGESAGPDIVRYYRVGEPDLYRMEVGIPVKPQTRPAGDAQLATLPPYRCAGLLLWGSLAHIVEAYETLQRAMREAGLEHTGECREWNYWFESSDSPNNLMGVYLEVR
jgi:hypothetical protein